MVKWGAKRFQILCLEDEIKAKIREGESLPQIHKLLSESEEIDISLTAFRRYAAPMRDEVLHSQVVPAPVNSEKVIPLTSLKSQLPKSSATKAEDNKTSAPVGVDGISTPTPNPSSSKRSSFRVKTDRDPLSQLKRKTDEAKV